MASATAGEPLVPRVGALAAPIREAVARTAEELQLDLDAYGRVFAPRAPHLGYEANDISSDRAAWSLVSVWLAGYSVEAFDATATFRDAEDWFYGDRVQDLPRVAPYLRPFWLPLPAAQEVRALLPYLLDTHGLGTRRAVLSDRRQVTHQRRRRRSGVYYTPGDVASLMLKACTRGTAPERSLFDPAVGTGVFPWAAALLGLVDRLGLYGIDRDGAIAERTASVLLSATIRTLPDISPWAVWHLHRMNIATRNALTMLTKPADPSTEDLAKRQDVRSLLLSGEFAKPAVDQSTGQTFVDVFPELCDGAQLVVSNPPYVRMESIPHRETNGKFEIFENAPHTSSTNTYLPFVELATKTVDPNQGALCVVVPLSIGFDSSKHATNLRTLLESRKQGGWEFRFFDRTPDALFGDDIKTRNCIATWRADSSGIASTPILRWTSRTRHQFLAALPEVTQISTSIRAGIPKLGSPNRARLYDHFENWPVRIESVCDLTSISPHSVAEIHDDRFATLAVAPTAYNWFNVVRMIQAFAEHDHDAHTEYLGMNFETRQQADAAYALLSSRLVFWLWRTTGDGFHVTRKFLTSVPWPFSANDESGLFPRRVDALETLADIGRRLWALAEDSPKKSVNRGRKTVAFPVPASAAPLMTELDSLLFDLFGVTAGSTFDLREWHRKLVIVDECDERRRAYAD